MLINEEEWLSALLSTRHLAPFKTEVNAEAGGRRINEQMTMITSNFGYQSPIFGVFQGTVSKIVHLLIIDVESCIKNLKAHSLTNDDDTHIMEEIRVQYVYNTCVVYKIRDNVQ